MVAEGAESDAVIDELRELGCHVVQGYGISRPLPAAAFERWLQEHKLAAVDGAGLRLVAT